MPRCPQCGNAVRPERGEITKLYDFSVDVSTSPDPQDGDLRSVGVTDVLEFMQDQCNKGGEAWRLFEESYREQLSTYVAMLRDDSEDQGRAA